MPKLVLTNPFEGPLESSRFARPITASPGQTQDIATGIQLVIQGRAPLLVVEGAIPEKTCRVLALRMHALNRRSDAVPIHELGPSHYGVPADEYLVAAREASKQLASFLEGVDPNPVMTVNSMIARALGAESVYRPAEKDGMIASDYRARRIPGAVYEAHRSVSGMTGAPFLRWAPADLPLALHEDRSQVLESTQNSFEIRDVLRVCGVNICVETHPDAPANDLHIWNKFGGEDADSLGLEAPGYGYPRQYVQGMESLRYRPKVGDVYIVLADLIHAVSDFGFHPFSSESQVPGEGDRRRLIYEREVSATPPPISADRSSLSWFIGRLPSGDVIRWT